MGQTTEQIAEHIEEQQKALGQNFRELEHKVKSATDWRQHYKKHPGLMCVAAIGGGALLAILLRSDRHS